MPQSVAHKAVAEHLDARIVAMLHCSSQFGSTLSPLQMTQRLSSTHSVRTSWPLLAVAIAVVMIGGCGDDDGDGSRDAAADAADTADAADAGFDGDTGLGVDARADDDGGDGLCAIDVDCDDGILCTIDRCDSASGACEHLAPDLDGDQHGDATCLGRDGTPLGDDCDDTDANRFPGNVEVCVPGRLSSVTDEDCDPTTFGSADTDRDAHANPACCNEDALGVLHCGDDCDPHNGDVYPGANEYCDGIDNDCDREIDEAEHVEGLYIDRDGDGYGNDTDVIDACTLGSRTVTRAGDCDDSDYWRHPGATEACDNVDNDCDEIVDEGIHCGPCDCSPPRALQVECPVSPTACAITACEWGYADCDGEVANGCETDVTTADNCGTCGTVCDDRADCVSTTWGFLCKCDIDHELVDQVSTECVDRDGCVDCGDCAVDNGGCDGLTQCSQQGELRSCGECPPGYAGNGNNGCRPTLTGLVVDGGALVGTLHPDTTNYVIDVHPMFDRATLALTAVAGASVTIFGRAVTAHTPWLSPSVAVTPVGTSVVVTAAGDRVSQYSFTLRRSTRSTFVKPSRTQIGASFGGATSWMSPHSTRTVDLDAGGTILIVGVPGERHEDSEAADRVGAAYVFTRASGQWTAQQRLTSPPGGVHEFFGTAAAISADGNTLAVGAPGIYADPTQYDDLHAGRVYVYARAGNDWTLHTTLTAAGAEPGDGFGTAVSLSTDGTTIAIGAPGEASNARGVDGDRTNNEAIGAGAVYVFGRSGDVWSERAYLKASNAGGGDGFGFSLALNGAGDSVVIGAPTERSSATLGGGSPDDDSLQSAGAAYVFTRALGVWSEDAYVKAFNTSAGSLFGASVAFAADSDVIAIGAQGEPSVNADGESVSYWYTSYVGAVYLYERRGTAWVSDGFLKPSVVSLYSRFATSLALSPSGRHVIVGAPGAPSTSVPLSAPNQTGTAVPGGAVYAFTRGAFGWRQHTPVYLPNATYGDAFGASVAMSADVSITAIGAPGDQSAATGINGDRTNQDAPNSGAVYVFD